MANVKLGTKAVGSIVKLKVNGTATEFIVAHQGKPSSMYDESCNGTWLLMKGIYEKRQWHSSNSNSYKASTIHSYLNSTFLGLFDSNIQAAIKEVKIPYVNGTANSAVASGANGLAAKIFMLSGYEVGWTQSTNSYFPIDGACLSYFSGTAATDSKRIGYLNGVATYWWLRSPYTSSTYGALGVNTRGSYSNGDCSNSFGIRPALVLPPDMGVDSSGNVTPPVDLTAHKTLVNGTAYTVKGGKCLVNSTVYSIKKGRTLIGGTGYDITFGPSYDPVFANNTWAQIIEACHNNEVPDTWNVADHKPMTINGVDYQIDIIGKNHDDYSDGSGKAPLTFQMHDCYRTRYEMNASNTNVGGWGSSDMRITQLPKILALMPAEVRSGIREVNKLTSAGNKSTSIVTKQDKLFLLSEIEIFDSVTNSKRGEGTQYDYYKAGNSKVKNRGSSASSWWERSPNSQSSEKFCYVYTRGNAASANANSAYGVAFAFCF